MGLCSKLALFIVLLAVAGPLIYRYRDQREYNLRTTADEAANGVDLFGKVIIVTGANTGIGKPTARVLLKQGATVIMACRRPPKAKEAAQDIIQKLNKLGLDKKDLSQRLIPMKLDLADLKSVDDFSEKLQQKYDRIDYLVFNAGINFPEWRASKDGIESMFQVNHVGHFRLAMNLTPLLIKSSNDKSIGRVISVSSYAQKYAYKPLTDWFKDDSMIQNKTKFNAFKMYSLSKTANVLFAAEYNERYNDSNVYAMSLHPGSIPTELIRDYPTIVQYLWHVVATTMLKTRDQGAATTVRLASISDDEFKKFAGSYWSDCNPANDDLRADIFPNNVSNEEETPQKLLWKLTETMIKKYYK